jgi:hypothetical protein
MTLPKQVQRQLDEIEALEKHLGIAPVPEPVPEPTPEASAEPAAEPAPVEPVPEPVPEPIPEPAEDPKWEQRYRALQGKYDAEVPRLHAETRDLRASYAQLLAQVQSTAREVGHYTPAADPPPVQAPNVDKYREVFGGDLVDATTDIARTQAEQLFAAQRAEIDQLKTVVAQLGDGVRFAQGTSFEARLAQAIPDFAQIEADPRWSDWLNEVDPLLRAPRRSVAAPAYERQDVEAVRGYVDLFRATLPAPEPAPSVDRQRELRRQVQPVRTSASAPVTAQARTYTATEARAAWAQVQRLNASGDFARAQALEDEISAALVEGRAPPT